MEDNSSFGPSTVVAVGLSESDVVRLEDECLARRYRLVVADSKANLPLSLACDFAIINTLLPDGDGRQLAVDFGRAGAAVQLEDNVGAVPLFDAWSLGATSGESSKDPADWLDELTADHVDAVLRAGRLMEALRLADSVSSSASFSASTGVPVSFVRIRPHGSNTSGVNEALDRLTSVVGVTTVFHDAPTGERFALVVNGDRRRLVKLLDDPNLRSETDIAIVAVTPGDDLASLIGRSLFDFWKSTSGEDRVKVLVAVAKGHEKTLEALRLALHKMDVSPIFWSADFNFEDLRSGMPSGVIVDLRHTNGDVSAIIDGALSQDPAIPVLAITDVDHIDGLRAVLERGVTDFLVWPFASGEAQAALARVLAIGSETLKSRPRPLAETEAAAEPESESALETEPEPQIVLESEPSDRVETVLARLIAGKLSSGETVLLEGLGVLSTHHETSRIIHDQHGRTIVEPPKQAVSFSPESDPGSDS